MVQKLAMDNEQLRKLTGSNNNDSEYWKGLVDTWKNLNASWEFQAKAYKKLYFELKKSDDLQGEDWKKLTEPEEEEKEADYDYSDCKITDINRFKKPKHLICIEPGDWKDVGLEFLGRYIANGTCISDGDPCYYIDNWGGSGKERIKKISRFIIPKNPPKQ
jgi:hypothetical protein